MLNKKLLAEKSEICFLWDGITATCRVVVVLFWLSSIVAITVTLAAVKPRKFDIVVITPLI